MSVVGEAVDNEAPVMKLESVPMDVDPAPSSKIAGVSPGKQLMLHLCLFPVQILFSIISC